MSVRHFVLSSLVLAALARATSVLAEDSPDKPVLGPVEPIGELLVLKAGFDNESQTLPPAPSPLLELKPISIPPGLLLSPADITIPDGYGMPGNGMLRATARITPSDEIALHLSQAVLSLTAAGLNEEAKQVGSLLRDFETKHQPRLLLAAKQAQLNELQAEIDRLKRRVEKEVVAEQVSISIKMFETNDTAALKLLKESLGLPETEQTANAFTQPKTLSKQDLEKLMESLQDKDGVRILCSPRLIVQSGQTGEVNTGGKFLIPLPVGGSEERSFGSFVTASPTITDKDQIRLAVTVENSELDMASVVTINNTTIPGLSRRRVQTTLELKDGQTVVLGGLISTRNDKSTELFITVMAEIVQPFDKSIDPIAPQPIPAPLLK